jgi:exopolyphosphatase/guanosine-5'-triphosphate,3'-diphosphate pyrophosphatase
MASRYHVDKAQAERVADTASNLLMQCVGQWNLDIPFYAQVLDWSSRLHEIGLDISHDEFERHGAYIAEHADLPGFPRAEQRLVAFLIGSQRYQINRQYLKLLPKSWRNSAMRLAILLRLAVLLNRSRSQVSLPPIALKTDNRALELRFDKEWLQANPLTVADLERERSYLENMGYELRYG